MVLDLLSITMYKICMHSGIKERMLTTQVNIRLNRDIHGRLTDLAEEKTTSISQLIREAVIQFLRDGRS